VSVDNSSQFVAATNVLSKIAPPRLECDFASCLITAWIGRAAAILDFARCDVSAKRRTVFVSIVSSLANMGSCCGHVSGVRYHDDHDALIVLSC
jgi:hypothetical protein